MKFHSKGNKEDTNFVSSKVIKAQIGNPAKMLRMFSKDLYKNPLQTAIQEYINNAKDAHTMVGKNPSTIEITAPTLANQSVIIKDSGPGLSPDEIVNIFANVSFSNKDNSDLFNGGYGIGSKSWLSVNSSFIVISNFEGTKSFYNVKSDEIDGIVIEYISDESTNESNGLEVHLPLANSSQIEQANLAIHRALEFWKVKPKLINFNLEFENFSYSETDFSLISFNNDEKLQSRLGVTLGETQYSIKDLPSYIKIKNILRFFNVILHFDIGEMNLNNTQEVGPDRESFSVACDYIILKKAEKVALSMVKRTILLLEEDLTTKQYNDILSSNFSINSLLNGYNKKFNDEVQLNFYPNVTKRLEFLPIMINKKSIDYVAINQSISSAKTYIQYCVKVKTVLFVDEENVSESKIRDFLRKNINNYGQKSRTKRPRTFDGITLCKSNEFSKESIEILKKFFNVLTYVKEESEPIIKVKKEKKPDEINLIKQSTNCFSNKIVKINNLSKDTKIISKDNLLDWSEIDYVARYFKESVVLVSKFNFELLKSLNFEVFDFNSKNEELEKLELEKQNTIKERFISEKVIENLSKQESLNYFNYVIHSSNIVFFMGINHPIYIRIKELMTNYSLEKNKKLLNEFSSLLTIEIPQDKDLLIDFKQLVQENYIIFRGNQFFPISTDINFLNDVKFLLESKAKK